MTTAEYRALLKRTGLRQVDVCWMMGITNRAGVNWRSGRSPIPQSAALLLLALEQGKVKPRWLRKHIKEPIPYSEKYWR